jgi:hypothetical protein
LVSSELHPNKKISTVIFQNDKKGKGEFCVAKGKRGRIEPVVISAKTTSLQFLVVEMSFRRSIFRLAERNDVQPALKKVIL